MTAIPAGEAPLAVDSAIGTNIHNLLWTRRIQQKELARALMLTPSVLSKKIRGASSWSAVQIQISAEFFDVSPGRLFEQPTQPYVSLELAHVTDEPDIATPRRGELTLVPSR